jgi:23S rRNA (adenine1618-N6)-methyltransferase
MSKPSKPRGASRTTPPAASIKASLHPRNPHQGRYDLGRLQAASSELQPFVRTQAQSQQQTIDFADPLAVKALNRAILAADYGIQGWDIPEGYLCPPIPGRADHIHHLADLLASCHKGKVPTGDQIRVLDIGVGANAIYPIIGHHAYGWSFVGSDVDADSLAAVARIQAANPSLSQALVCRRQPDVSQIFGNIIQAGDIFDLTLCNPPFHASAQEAAAGSLRKVRNLNSQKARNEQRANLDQATLNFGGRQNELWCEGGELKFILRMIHDSQRFAGQVFWFSTLVSKVEHVAPLRKALIAAKAVEVRVIDMAQGQKTSRLVAWTFQPLAQQQAWSRFRWG